MSALFGFAVFDHELFDSKETQLEHLEDENEKIQEKGQTMFYLLVLVRKCQMVNTSTNVHVFLGMFLLYRNLNLFNRLVI